MTAQASQRAGGGERLHVMTIELGAARQIIDIRKRIRFSRGDHLLAGNLGQSFDHAQAETKRGLRWALRCAIGFVFGTMK